MRKKKRYGAEKAARSRDLSTKEITIMEREKSMTISAT